MIWVMLKLTIEYIDESTGEILSSTKELSFDDNDSEIEKVIARHAGAIYRCVAGGHSRSLRVVIRLISNIPF